jgi:multidrug transporter EmrE-like cation transporter
MNILSIGLVITAVLINAVAQLLLKAGTNSIGAFAFSRENIQPVGWQLATEPHILGGMTCYVISLVVWIMALSRVEVSIAYPMLSIGYIVNAIGAWYLLGEAVTLPRIIGIGIIVLGVYILARS